MYEENPNYPYLNFPSPLLPDDDLFLGTALPYPSPPPPPPPPPMTDAIREKAKGKRKADTITTTTTASGGGKHKRRRGKTDRHSKIHTAKGPRDRRMRLSVQIARKFFDLQDMLGFDKASKTIEWLFNKSKSAIKDLTHGTFSSMPAPSDQPVNGGNCKVDNGIGKATNEKKNKEKGRKVIKGALLFEVMRGNRENARARARERTKEKNLLMIQKQGNDQNPNCSSTIRVGQIMEQSHDEYGRNYTNNDHDHQQQQYIPLEDQMASIGIIEKYLTTSSSTLFDFDHNNHDIQHRDHTMIGPSHEMDFTGFPVNWISQNITQNPNYASFIGNPEFHL